MNIVEAIIMASILTFFYTMGIFKQLGIRPYQSTLSKVEDDIKKYHGKFVFWKIPTWRVLSLDSAIFVLAKLMDRNKFVSIIVRSVGTFVLPMFVLMSLSFTFARLLRNPMKPFSKHFKDLLEGSELENWLGESSIKVSNSVELLSSLNLL